MKSTYLDVGETHGNNNPCPATRFSMLPNGQWQCVDCGAQIIWKTFDVARKPSKYSEVAACTQALRRKMDSLHPDDVGDGLRNKVNDLLRALSEAQHKELLNLPGLLTLKKKAIRGPFNGGEQEESWGGLARLVVGGPYAWVFVSAGTYEEMRWEMRPPQFQVVTKADVIASGVVAYLGTTPVVVAPGVHNVVLVAGATYDTFYRVRVTDPTRMVSVPGSFLHSVLGFVRDSGKGHGRTDEAIEAHLRSACQTHGMREDDANQLVEMMFTEVWEG